MYSCRSFNHDDNYNILRHSNFSNNLFSLLCKEDEVFREELERESVIFAKNYGFKKNGFLDSRQVVSFPDNAYFIDYLKGDMSLLRRSLSSGYFLDAAIAAYRQGYAQNKIHMLLEKGEIQTQRTQEPLFAFVLEKTSLPLLEQYVLETWLSYLFNELIGIKESSGRSVTFNYGETKQKLLSLARKRYEELIQRYPSALEQEEKREYEKLLY